MILDWLRSRRALHAELDDAHADNVQLTVELEDLNDQNDALTEQLATARVEINARKDELTKLDTQLAETARDRDRAWQDLANLGGPAKTDNGIGEMREPRSLHAELQREKARADALARRLEETQQKSLALDVPFS